MSDTEAEYGRHCYFRWGLGEVVAAPPNFSFLQLGSANYRKAMSQLKVTYKDVYSKPVSTDVLDVVDLDDAISNVVDFCIRHPRVWQGEISNAAGFVCRVSFNQARKPVAELCRIPLKKYTRPRSRKSHQLTLFAL